MLLEPEMGRAPGKRALQGHSAGVCLPAAEIMTAWSPVDSASSRDPAFAAGCDRPASHSSITELSSL